MPKTEEPPTDRRSDSHGECEHDYEVAPIEEQGCIGDEEVPHWVCKYCDHTKEFEPEDYHDYDLS